MKIVKELLLRFAMHTEMCGTITTRTTKLLKLHIQDDPEFIVQTLRVVTL